jgi:hypothetical protein
MVVTVQHPQSLALLQLTPEVVVAAHIKAELLALVVQVVVETLEQAEEITPVQAEPQILAAVVEHLLIKLQAFCLDQAALAS